jgi:hypothetical protein
MTAVEKHKMHHTTYYNVHHTYVYTYSNKKKGREIMVIVRKVDIICKGDNIRTISAKLDVF